MKLSDLPSIRIKALDTTTDPLDLLVLGLALRMKQLSKTSTEFMALIEQQQFCLQIGHDGGIARQILVNHGKVSTRSGSLAPADFVLQFRDSDLAVSTLLQADPALLMHGMQNGSIKMQGDFALLVWFNQVATFIPPHIPEPIKIQLKNLAQRIKAKFR